jgi:hypothetical protein
VLLSLVGLVEGKERRVKEGGEENEGGGRKEVN